MLISITVPSGVVTGTLEVTTITATSRSNINLWALVTDTTLIAASYKVYLPLIMK